MSSEYTIKDTSQKQKVELMNNLEFHSQWIHPNLELGIWRGYTSGYSIKPDETQINLKETVFENKTKKPLKRFFSISSYNHIIRIESLIEETVVLRSNSYKDFKEYSYNYLEEVTIFNTVEEALQFLKETYNCNVDLTSLGVI